MIASGYNIADLHEMREAAGPNPEGSKLTDDERIHLIYMIGAMNRAILEEDEHLEKFSRVVWYALSARGMRTHHIADAFQDGDVGSAVSVADRIAVHPALRSA